MAQNATLYIDQGTTYRAVISLIVPPAAGAPIPSTPAAFDLTGCSAEMMIRSGYGAPTVWQTLTSASGGGLALGGSAGTITMVLTPEQTAAFPMPALANGQQIPICRGVFDLVITLADGDVVRVLQGTVNVSGGVTLPTGPGEPQ